jgi:RNA polymerase sigma factor (sigma-70 family)
MPPARLHAALRAAASSARADGRPDAELLARFLEAGDEAAFETLLLRHTPGVRAACRSWLRSDADIDDAAQATFLVLVQRGRSIRDQAAVGRWLYGVAANVARRLRKGRRASCPLPPDVPGSPPADDDDLRDPLAEEVARLPEKYRLPVQLCYSAGLTTSEAAQRLGWPKGTVLTRLAWARQRLQKRLTRRGLVPVVLAGAAWASAPAASRAWVRATARAAGMMRAGETLASTGLSRQVISLTEGVVRAMAWNKSKYVALVVLLAACLIGFGVLQWGTAADGPGDQRKAQGDAPGGKEGVRGSDARPGTTGRRREAVIRVPAGTFTKEIEAAPYGSGRLTWTYEDERVVGLIEGSIMGVEFELATEAEYSLSSNGTIYGLLTGVRLNHLRVPETKEFEDLKPYVNLWPVAEPLVNEVLMDLPFSYQFRVQGDRLVISNFRMLLAGPNPMGKVGGLLAQQGQNDKSLAFLAYFQALGTAIEGTYTTPDAREKAAPHKRPPFQRSRGLIDVEKGK